MLDQLGAAARKLSFVALAVGGLAAFYTEAFADIPVGRDGRPKPPLKQQRLIYLAIFAAGLPGVAWGCVRAARDQQRTPWE